MEFVLFCRRQKYAEVSNISPKQIDGTPRQRLYGCSFDYTEEDELNLIWQNQTGSSMSTSSSAGTGGYSMNSGRQTPDRSLSESRTTSLSSIRSELSEASPVASPQIRLHSPFLERLFVDSASLQSMNLMTSIQSDPWKRTTEHNKSYITKSTKIRDLVLPEEEKEEYPFAKHTFNKKPKKVVSSSSEISSGSKDSSLSPWGSLNSTRNKSYIRHGSTTSSQWSEDLSSTETGTSNGSFNTSFSSKQSNSSNYPPSPEQCYSNPGFPPSFQPYNMPNPRMFSQYSLNEPDQILYNLGFGESPETFLPERFAQDWYKKIQQSKMNQVKQQLAERLNLEPQYSDFSYVDNVGIPSAAGQTNLPLKIPKNHAKSTQREHSRLPQIRMQEKENLQTKFSDNKLSVSKFYELLKRENQHFFQENNSSSTKDFRRKQFASHRQKSLPTYLETLTEEDEIRTKSGFEKSRRMEKVMETHAESTSSEDKSCSLSQDMNSDLSDSGSSTQELQDNVMESQLQRKHVVPSILICQSPVRDVLESKDSLEVANILSSTSEEDSSSKQNSYKTELHLEPAMLSMVLQDAESARPNQLLTVMRPNGNGEYSEDRHHLASPSSASSISPCPLSPVTVIEVNLDNQSDSMDTEEGGNSNQSTRNSVDKDSSPGDNPAGLSPTGGKEQKETLTCPFPPLIVNFPKTSANVEHELNSVNSVLSSMHDSVKEPFVGTCEAVVQTEDNSLSPLLGLNDLDGLLKKILSCKSDLYYVVEDKEIQCDLIKESSSLDTLTKPENKIAGVSTSQNGLTLKEDCDSVRLLEDSNTGQQYTSSVSVMVQTDPDLCCSCLGNRHKRGRNNAKSFLGLTEGSYNVKNDANFSRIFSSSFCDSVSDESINGSVQSSLHSPDRSNCSSLEVTLDRLENKAQQWRTMISQQKWNQM